MEIVERIEFVHRRLERAKRLIEAGHLQTAQSSAGPLYICRSQTDPTKVYVVQKESCPCKDTFHWEGRKLCKHILARLIIEGAIPLEKIGQDPCYWQRHKNGRNCRKKGQL